MNCPNCQAPNDATATVCSHCGAQLPQQPSGSGSGQGWSIRTPEAAAPPTPPPYAGMGNPQDTSPLAGGNAPVPQQPVGWNAAPPSTPAPQQGWNLATPPASPEAAPPQQGWNAAPPSVPAPQQGWNLSPTPPSPEVAPTQQGWNPVQQSPVPPSQPPAQPQPAQGWNVVPPAGPGMQPQAPMGQPGFAPNAGGASWQGTSPMMQQGRSGGSKMMIPIMAVVVVVVIIVAVVLASTGSVGLNQPKVFGAWQYNASLSNTVMGQFSSPSSVLKSPTSSAKIVKGAYLPSGTSETTATSLILLVAVQDSGVSGISLGTHFSEAENGRTFIGSPQSETSGNIQVECQQVQPSSTNISSEYTCMWQDSNDLGLVEYAILPGGQSSSMTTAMLYTVQAAQVITK